MNSLQRFHATLSYGSPDRPPLFEDGLRDNVLDAWRSQGLPLNTNLNDLFSFDQREEIGPELDSNFDLETLVNRPDGLVQFRHSLDESDPKRLPEDWKNNLAIRKEHQFPNILCIGRGLFLSLGIEGGCSFITKMYLLADHPDFVEKVLWTQSEFAVRLVERILAEIPIDALLFSEPIAGMQGPLVSPRLYEKLVLPSYQPLFDLARKQNIAWLILRTYANPRSLLEAQVRFGFNVLWAVERNPQAVDYLAIRRQFGKQLRLVGGIDVDAIRQGNTAIRMELDEIVLPLLADGGFIPLADGRIREDIPFKNYSFYRKLLEQVTLQE